MTATIRMSSASRQPKFRCERAPKRGGQRRNHRAAAPAARRQAAGAGDRARHPQETDRLGDVVDAEDGRAGGRRGGERRERAGQPVGRDGVLRDAREAPDESLAGRAGGDRKAERAKRREVAQQDEVVLGALPNPRPGSIAIASAATPAASARPAGVGEERGDVAERVGVLEVVLHRARVGALHVHEDSAGAHGGGGRKHGRVEAPRRDVVDEVRPGLERRARDGGLARVDRERAVPSRSRMPAMTGTTRAISSSGESSAAAP